jgi:threonyl-tRNA synthetase
MVDDLFASGNTSLDLDLCTGIEKDNQYQKEKEKEREREREKERKGGKERGKESEREEGSTLARHHNHGGRSLRLRKYVAGSGFVHWDRKR